MRLDPTRTTLLRNRFLIEVRKHFGKLRQATYAFIYTHDALGLRPISTIRNHPLTMATPVPRAYAFQTDPKKLDSFNKWFRQQVQEDIITPVSGSTSWTPPYGSMGSGPWTNKYVESAYKRGTINAYMAANQQDLAESPDFAGMSQDRFLRQAFSQPERISKVELLATRAWENMKGVTDSMGTQMNQILSQGMIDGSGAQEIADDMTDAIDSLTDTRALVIARTEIIHAHAEGQLDTFADLGIDELGVEVEWSTAGDDRVCEDCADMEGQTFSIDDARGMIPLHPNCRCSWIPAVKDNE